MKRIPPQPRAPQPLSKVATQLFAQAVQHYEQGRLDAALQICRQLLARSASMGRAHLLVGVIEYTRNNFASAESSLRKAVQLLGSGEAYTNLALALVEQGKPEEAEAAYRQAVQRDPQQAQAWNNLGNLMVSGNDRARIQEAISYYQKALQARPNYPRAHTNLGFAHEQLGDKTNAELHYRKALELDPQLGPALSNLANLLEFSARAEEALPLYLAAWRQTPEDVKLMANAVGLRNKLVDWRVDNGPGPADVVRVLEQQHQHPQKGSVSPLSLLAWPEASAPLQRENARRFARQRWAVELNRPPLVSKVAAHEGRRIRLGYLSADFRNHPVTHLVADVFAHHDRAHFEVFLYAYGPAVEDEERRMLRNTAEHFVDLSAEADLAAAQRIAGDGIDILVDLTGYTTHARLGITAARPAPVIVSWLGFIGSLGEPRLADYVIGDAIATPVSHAEDFSETLALMPHCYQPNRALTPLAPPPSRQEEGLPETGVVFCSFNQSFKLHPALWDDWCRILSAVDHSVLWLAPMDSHAQANLHQAAVARGVAPERLIFAKRQPLPKHQARIALADIALDTYPYNSGTTASDALRVGVPLVTVAGETFVARMAASLLHNLGMGELVMPDRAAYVQLAISLAQDATRRQTLKGRLQANLRTSTLFDPGRFTQSLEKLFRAMLTQKERGEHGVIRIEEP